MIDLTDIEWYKFYHFSVQSITFLSTKTSHVESRKKTIAFSKISEFYHFVQFNLSLFFPQKPPMSNPGKKKDQRCPAWRKSPAPSQRIHRRRVHGDDTHTWRLIFWWFPWKCHGIFSGFHGDVMGIYSDFMGISCWWVGIYWLLNETLIGFHDYNEI